MAELPLERLPPCGTPLPAPTLGCYRLRPDPHGGPDFVARLVRVVARDYGTLRVWQRVQVAGE